jgi:hypothetical protein
MEFMSYDGLRCFESREGASREGSYNLVKVILLVYLAVILSKHAAVAQAGCPPLSSEMRM